MSLDLSLDQNLKELWVFDKKKRLENPCIRLSLQIESRVSINVARIDSKVRFDWPLSLKCESTNPLIFFTPKLKPPFRCNFN